VNAAAAGQTSRSNPIDAARGFAGVGSAGAIATTKASPGGGGDVHGKLGAIGTEATSRASRRRLYTLAGRPPAARRCWITTIWSVGLSGRPQKGHLQLFTFWATTPRTTKRTGASRTVKITNEGIRRCRRGFSKFDYRRRLLCGARSSSSFYVDRQGAPVDGGVDAGRPRSRISTSPWRLTTSGWRREPVLFVPIVAKIPGSEMETGAARRSGRAPPSISSE